MNSYSMSSGSMVHSHKLHFSRLPAPAASEAGGVLGRPPLLMRSRASAKSAFSVSVRGMANLSSVDTHGVPRVRPSIVRAFSSSRAGREYYVHVMIEVVDDDPQPR